MAGLMLRMSVAGDNWEVPLFLLTVRRFLEGDNDDVERASNWYLATLPRYLR